MRLNFLKIVRCFSSDADIKNIFVNSLKYTNQQVQSRYEPRANELINAIRINDYNHAKRLVLCDKIDVDGHDVGENTALTDAAKRGDLAGVDFLMEHLRANANACCHCPQFRTALHYAAEYSHTDVLKSLLIKHKANPLSRDANNKTPLHFANNDEIRQILIRHQNTYSLMLPNKSTKLLPK